MGVASDLIDGVVEVSTGSVELIATKWSAIVGGGLALFVLLLLVVLLFVAPVVGLGLAAIVLIALWIFAQGDNDLI